MTLVYKSVNLVSRLQHQNVLVLENNEWPRALTPVYFSFPQLISDSYMIEYVMIGK